MNPFEAIGEALTDVGLWLMDRVCWLRGHKWEASVYPEPHNTHIEAWYCLRCYRVEYPQRACHQVEREAPEGGTG